MKEKIKKFAAASSSRANSTRGTLVAIVGIYIGYLGYQLLEGTKSGESSMSMTVTLVFMVLMMLIGLIVFAYGAMVFYYGWQKEKESYEDASLFNRKIKKRSRKMQIYSVFDDEFKAYGKVLEGYDTAELTAAMDKIAMPEGVSYEPGIESLEACGIFKDLSDRAYGGMPVQLGMCWGYNTKLNCLEYHRDSEINIGSGDFILLLAKQDEITDGVLDTSCVKAFKAPAGAAVEVYATTLHYAPCHVDADKGFRVAVVLPYGTNTAKPDYEPMNDEDTWLTARNKWLLAHPDADEAKQGAHIGLKGINIDLDIN